MARKLPIKQSYDNTLCNFYNLMSSEITPDNAPYIQEDILHVQAMIIRQGYMVGDINYKRLVNLNKMYCIIGNYMRTGQTVKVNFNV